MNTNQKCINKILLITTALVMSTCVSPHSLTRNTPEQVVDRLMYLLNEKMDFEQLISLGDYPHIDSSMDLNFYLLDMRKLIPDETYLTNTRTNCYQFERRFKHHYINHKMVNYTELTKDRKNCINEMNKIGTQIGKVYDLNAGISFISSTYSKNKTKAVLEYRANSDRRKIELPMIQKNEKWYFEDFGSNYLVNHFGHL